MRNRVLIAASAALVAGAALWMLGARGGEGTDLSEGAATRPLDGATRATAQAGARSRPSDSPPPSGAEPPPSLATMPRSLQETEVDGQLRVDSNGDLIVDAEMRNFFDYFLIASHEEPETNIRARILAEIRKRLPAKAAAQAVEVFEKYMKYREEVADLASNPHGAADLEGRLADVKRIRREQLGPANADAMFGLEEALDAVTVQRKKIEADPALPLEEKRRRVEALEAQLPPDLQLARAQSLAPLRNFQEEQAMIAAGATPEDIHQFREQTVGPTAAQRLEQMEREEAAFQARVAVFRAERQRMIEAGATPQQLDAALRAAFPLEPERLRAITLVEMQ